MARVKGVEIPDNKRLEVSLTYIYGIGKSIARKIVTDLKLDKNKKVMELSNDELTLVRDEVNKYTVEGDLRRDKSINIKTKMEINSYEGTRHRKKLPVRGQRTNRNARTAKGGKGRVVANKKK